MNQHAQTVAPPSHNRMAKSAGRDGANGGEQQRSALRMGWTIIRTDTEAPDEVVKLNVGPVVFNVPERANSSKPNLYIVVQGCHHFRRRHAGRQAQDKDLRDEDRILPAEAGESLSTSTAPTTTWMRKGRATRFSTGRSARRSDLGDAAKERGSSLDCEIEPVMGRILGNVRYTLGPDGRFRRDDLKSARTTSSPRVLRPRT